MISSIVERRPKIITRQKKKRKKWAGYIYVCSTTSKKPRKFKKNKNLLAAVAERQKKKRDWLPYKSRIERESEQISRTYIYITASRLGLLLLPCSPIS